MATKEGLKGLPVVIRLDRTTRLTLKRLAGVRRVYQSDIVREALSFYLNHLGEASQAFEIQRLAGKLAPVARVSPPAGEGSNA